MAKSISIHELREKVKLRHLESAFALIDQGDGQDARGTQTLKNTKRNLKGVVPKDGKYYALMDMGRLAYLFALKELGEISEDPPFSESIKKIGSKLEDSTFGNLLLGHGEFKNYRGRRLNGIKPTNAPTKEDSMTDPIIDKALGLLRQFYQIIFYGPPGTGKTRAARLLLPSLLDVEKSKVKSLQGRRWDIVQFHPSYNYEDFIRGIRAKTVEGKVAYETVNRTFGEMCYRANEEYKKAGKDASLYALIIDEINRANVSAVLGELIYALEYRGDSVSTPYAVNPEDKKEGKGDPTLTIPENLYIIGTMNTADRTIGQIDYAVRRRFAFMHCGPQESEIKDKTARGFFADVDALFVKDDKKTPSDFISPDFDAADVRVGHSYFLVAGNKLGYKLVYQVVPILREYVKDGVLKVSATPQIDKIEEGAKELLLAGKPLADESEESDSSADNNKKSPYKGNFIFKWMLPDGRHNYGPLGQATLAIVKDYAEQRKPKNLGALLHALSLPANAVKKESEAISRSSFMQEHNKINFSEGERAVVSFSWTNNPDTQKWKKFVASAENFGYKISLCRFVIIGEGKSRSWADCRKYGFVCAGGQYRNGTEGFRKQLDNLQLGESVFAYCGDDVPKKRRGFVALGTVMSERAERIDEFKVGGRLLSKCPSEKGGSYEEAYPQAFAIGRSSFDYAVRVKWEKVLDEKDIVKISWNENTVSTRVNGFDKLHKAFNLGNEEKD